MGKGVAGGGTTSRGGQWEIPGGNVRKVLLLSSGSAVGISSQCLCLQQRDMSWWGGCTCHSGDPTGSIRTCG